MESKVFNMEELSAWNDYVMRNPYSIAWHMYEFSLLLKNHFGAEFYPLGVVHEGEIKGILPLYRIKPPFKKPRMISIPHMVAGGILADEEEIKSVLLLDAIKIAKENGIENITLKQYKVQVNENLRTDDNYYNRELYLGNGKDIIWEQLEDKNKKAISMNIGKTFAMEYPSQDIEVFYRMLVHQSCVQGIPTVSKRWIVDLIRLGMYNIALMRSGGAVVAGTMVKSFKKTVSFPFTCTVLPKPTGDQFIYKMYWELIINFINEGYEIFHSGRIPKNDQVDGYRLGWGGTRFGYYYQYYPNVDGATEFSSKRGIKRKVFQAIWRCIPSPVAGYIGPMIVREFP